MSTVIAIMDHDSWDENTDIIVVVDASRQRLTWVPRDLWSVRAGDRVNAAFRRGGHAMLAAVLGDLGLLVKASVCLRRAASERILESLTVTVPISRRMRFWYPLTPTTPIQDGRRLVTFMPPSEKLSGERLHQWIGARMGLDTTRGDLDRIVRQQVLVRRWLEEAQRCDWVLPPEWVSIAGAGAIDELRQVQGSWQFDALDDVRNAVMDGKHVLLPQTSPGWLRWLRRTVRAWRDVVRSRLTPSP